MYKYDRKPWSHVRISLIYRTLPFRDENGTVLFAGFASYNNNNIYLHQKEIRDNSNALVLKLVNKVLAAYNNTITTKKIRRLSMKYNREKITVM